MPRLFRKLALKKGRQLQFIETKHGKSQGDEDQRKCAQHPGVLQSCGQHRPGKAGCHACGGVCDRHSHDIGQR